MPNICLNMIVKNESGRIVRALKSAAPYITSWVICDTGSEDETPAIIRQFFQQERIPGHMVHAPFKDWSQARNAALIAARAAQPQYGWDYALLMDADMQLVVNDRAIFEAVMAGGASYDMEQRTGQLHYLNRRLIHKDATGLYRGVTHEYLDVPAAGGVPNSVAHFHDHADGANRPQKFARDIALLLAGLEQEPKNSRYYYYLAQSYRDAGDFDNAITWYKKRVDAGDWAEEQWSAQVNLAQCLLAKGDEEGFIRNMLVAYNMRPSRAETLYDLAHHFRLKDNMQNVAALFAQAGMAIPRTDDALFVSDYVYAAGLKEEFAITGFYNEQTRGKAGDVCDKLAMQPGPYEGARHTARSNLYWYIQPLKNHCASFTFKRIPFEPPKDWVAMNPSVTTFHGRVLCNVRCVNYRINEHGQYLIRGTDGTANDSNPINTRNFLLDIGGDPMVGTPEADEVMTPSLPIEFPPVIGLEDMRIFEHNGQLWSNSCVRQIHWDGNCEQFLGKINRKMGGTFITDWSRMLREPRATEKNWAYIPRPHAEDNKPWFMWRPGIIVDSDGKTIFNQPPKLTYDVISGSSQLVEYNAGWLALVHTAHQLPGSPCRYYYHRWAFYDRRYTLTSLSAPFVFEDRQIEFAAGLCIDPVYPTRLVVSYGVRDAEAHIGTVKVDEVMEMLCRR